MCKCTPNVRTPYCGKGDCQWPQIVDLKNDYDKVTRFEVIDHRPMLDSHGQNIVLGRIITLNNIKLEVSMQDEGRTLKIFITESEKVDKHDDMKICWEYLYNSNWKGVNNAKN